VGGAWSELCAHHLLVYPIGFLQDHIFANLMSRSTNSRPRTRSGTLRNCPRPSSDKRRLRRWISCQC
jgi:hypothetical protein